jgi:hypothetical protein
LRNKLRRIALYVGGLLVLAGMWSIVLFPTDEIIRYVQCRFAQMVPAANLSIDGLGLVLPPGLAVERVAVTFQNKSAAVADRLRILPGLTSLFQDRSSHPLQVRCVLNGLHLELPIPVMGSFQFSQIQADIGWLPEKLNIASVTAEGDQLNGRLSGDILMQTPVEKSRIQISGTVVLKPDTLTRLKTGVFGAVIPTPKADGGIPFQIAGTLAAPQFSFK